MRPDNATNHRARPPANSTELHRTDAVGEAAW